MEALSSPVLVLDGGGVCSSSADELATLALSSQTKVPALACLISSSYVCVCMCTLTIASNCNNIISHTTNTIIYTRHYIICTMPHEPAVL